MTFAAFALAALAHPQAAIEVPFRATEHAIIVDATVNGKELSFMFDTGFSGAFVVDESISIGKPTGKMNLRDFVGQFQADTVKLTSLKLGQKTIDPKDMEAVMQPADFTFSYNTHCDGIMGLEVIRNEITEINFEKGKFIFHPKSLDISKRTPDNKRTFLGKMLPLGHGAIVLDVTTPTKRKLLLSLDTGNAFYATTHRDVLERVGMWPADRKPGFMKTAMVASGPVDSWYKKMTDMVIYGVPVPVSYWSIIDLPSGSAESDGTVGYQFLKNFNIIIDYDRRRVWLENFSGNVGNEPEGQPGVTGVYDPRSKKVVIVKVWPDSPAHKAGIREGDFILSIDGKELTGRLGYREIEDLVDGKVGTKVVLSISRKGELTRYELERAALVNE